MANRASTSSDAQSREADDAFTTELLSYSLERLNKEPELLRADGDRVRRQMQELAVQQYGAFISAAECTAAVHSEVAGIREHLDALLQGLPALASGCSSFSEAAERIAASRAQNRQLLQQHGALLDLLEVGALLDTCVRNGSYDEALELEAFCSKLAVSAAGAPAAAALAEEARAGVRLLLAQLLLRLRGAVQLPECLRVVGYLRRLGAFTEPQLRTAFLRCRDAWLQACLAELDAMQAPYELAKRLTDTHRVHLFDSVMQYRAVFADDSSAADAASSSGGLVHAWATYRVKAYLDALAACLPRLTEGAALAGVLEHAAYCGASLGRVGLDFRGLLPPMFTAAAEQLVRRGLAEALDAFERALALHKLQPAQAGTTAAPPPPPADDAAPPAALMEQPPVAVLVNGVLASLNELRHVALPALRLPLAGAVHDTLRGAAGALARLHAARPAAEGQTPLCAPLAASLARVAAPYVAACYGRVYLGAQALVDADDAMEPLRSFLL